MTKAAADMAALTASAVMYLGASCAKKMLLAISPAALPQAMTTPEVRARALRLVMLVTVQEVTRGEVG